MPAIEQLRAELRAAEERRDTPEILRLRAMLNHAADKARAQASTEQAVSLLNRAFR